MKHALMLPPLILLSFFVLSALATGVFLLIGFSLPGLSLFLLPWSLLAIGFSLILVLSGALKRPLRGFPAYLFMLLTIAAIVTGSIAVTDWLVGDRTSVNPAEVRRPVATTVQPGTIYRGGDFALTVDAVTGAALRGVTIVSFDPVADPGVSRYPEAYLDRRNDELVIPDGADRSTAEIPGFGVVPMPPVVDRLVADTVASSAILRGAPEGATMPPFAEPFVPAGWRRILRTIITVAVLSLALAGMWTAMRIGRWPLLNIVVAIGYLRLLLAIPRLMGLPVVAATLQERSPQWLYADRVLYLWSILALISIIGAILLPSLKRWRHDMHYREDAA